MSEISLGRVTTLLLLGRAAGCERHENIGGAVLFGLLANLDISTLLTRTIARDPDAGGGLVPAAVRAQALLAGGVLIATPAFAAILLAQPVPLERIPSSLRRRANGRKQ